MCSGIFCAFLSHALLGQQGGRNKMDLNDPISEGNGYWRYFVVKISLVRPHCVYSSFIVFKLSLDKVEFLYLFV